MGLYSEHTVCKENKKELALGVLQSLKQGGPVHSLSQGRTNRLKLQTRTGFLHFKQVMQKN